MLLFQSRSQICKDSSSGHNHNYSNRKNVFIEQRGGVSRHQAQEPGQRARRHRGEGEARAQHRGQGGHGQGGGRGARPGGGVTMAEDVGWNSIVITVIIIIIIRYNKTAFTFTSSRDSAAAAAAARKEAAAQKLRATQVSEQKHADIKPNFPTSIVSKLSLFYFIFPRNRS